MIVVCDSVQTARPNQNGDESPRGRVENVMGTLKRAAKSIPCLVLAVSQANRASYASKDVNERTSPEAAGAESRAIEFDSDIVVFLDGDPEDSVKITATKNRATGRKFSLRAHFDRETASFTEIDEVETTKEKERDLERSLTDLCGKVLDLLARTPKLSGNQIHEALQGRRQDVYAAIRRLNENGRVKGEPKGRGFVWSRVEKPAEN